MNFDWTAGLNIETLSSVLIPALIFFLKGVWSKIPRWTIPAVAGALGIAANFLVALSTKGAVEPIVGFLAGLLGVGIREFLTQITRKVVNPPEDEVKKNITNPYVKKTYPGG